MAGAKTGLDALACYDLTALVETACRANAVRQRDLPTVFTGNVLLWGDAVMLGATLVASAG